MRKIEVSGLEGAALDWAVAKCEGGVWNPSSDGSAMAPYWVWPGNPDRISMKAPAYSMDPAKAYTIIEREKISVVFDEGDWVATKYGVSYDGQDEYPHGSSLLQAAMRCYVTAKLGPTIEVPLELVRPTTTRGNRP